MAPAPNTDVATCLRGLFRGKQASAGVEWCKEAVRRLGWEAALWLLALPRKGVGRGVTSDYHSCRGAVRAYAKEYGLGVLDDPPLREGYTRLCRVSIPDPAGGHGKVNLQDKPDLVRLTDVGQTLVAHISHNKELKDWVKDFIGIETEEEERWFPPAFGSPVPGAKIEMWTTRERPKGEEVYEVPTTAEFACPHPDCRKQIRHSYTFTWPKEAYSRKETVTCSGCGQVWAFTAGNPHRPPEVVDS